MNLQDENKYSNEFIISSCNVRAAEKSFDTVKKTGEKASVLFIYGPSPCGKTLLLGAAEELYLKQQGEKATKVSCHDFTDDLVMSINDNTKEEFYSKYGKEKLLLIDDTQHIVNFTSAQEAFAVVFERLVGQGVSIILFSEADIKDFEVLDVKLRKLPAFDVAFIRKADVNLRKKVLAATLRKEGVHIPKKTFYSLVFNKKIELASIKGCVLKIKFIKDLTGRLPGEKAMNKIIREYER